MNLYNNNHPWNRDHIKKCNIVTIVNVITLLNGRDILALYIILYNLTLLRHYYYL